MNAGNHNNSGEAPEMFGSPFESGISDELAVLSEEDQHFLQQNEGTIEKGRQAFLDVARALSAIEDYKDGILYRQKYGTFQSYCEKRWGFSRQHVYRMKDAAKEFETLSPRGDIPEQIKSSLKERHLREVRKVQDPETKVTVLKNAMKKSGGAVPTAKQLEEAVRNELNAANTTQAAKTADTSLKGEDPKPDGSSTPELRSTEEGGSNDGSEDAGASNDSGNTSTCRLVDGEQIADSVWSESTPCGQRLCSRKTEKPMAKGSSPTDPQANSTNHRNVVGKAPSGDGCDQTARPATIPAMTVSLMNGGKYRTEGWDDSTSMGRALRSSIEQMAKTPADQSAVTPTYKNSTARQQKLVLRLADAVFPEIGQSLSASKVKEIECACTQLIKVLTAAYHASRADHGADGQGELLFGEPEAEQGSSKNWKGRLRHEVCNRD